MDIYAKYINQSEYVINNPLNNSRPFFMTKMEVDEMGHYRSLYHTDGVCWESNIMDQIWENKYGWFDFSKSLIDIGAGAGEYPIFTGFAHSYAFEPNKRKQCLIYTNMLSFDKMDNIEVFPYAIGDTPGLKDFNGWSEDPAVTRELNNIYKIEYRTLDSFNFTNIGLIKLDIEGFELYAIKSGLGTIIRNDYPPILTELWNDSDINNYMGERAYIYMERRDELLDILQNLGYIMIPEFGDWETKLFIHHSQTQQKASE